MFASMDKRQETSHGADEREVEVEYDGVLLDHADIVVDKLKAFNPQDAELTESTDVDNSCSDTSAGVLSQTEREDGADINEVGPSRTSTDPHRDLNALFKAITEHQSNSLSSFDLVASNSFVSSDVRKIMGSALMNSYCIGLPGDRFYGGCSEIDKIELLTRELACQVFGAKYCEVQLLSGMLANIAAYNAMLPSSGGIVMASPAKNGGHYSHNAGGALTQLFGASVVRTPWLADTYNVDVDALGDALMAHKPDLLILGWSEMLFEHDLPTIRKICDQHGCKIMYDMSHVAGLVAGGVFQVDMMKYAHIVTSSTGKSFHSADHGLVLYNDASLTPKIREAVMPILTSNTHFHETAALALVLLEMQEFGAKYARQVVANSKALARALTRRNFTVLCDSLGYSETHEVILSLKINGTVCMKGPEATTLLDSAGIYVNPQELPYDTQATGITGLRLGTQVLTRRGFKEADMATVADALAEVLIKKAHVKKVAKSVASKCSHFNKVSFAFENEVQEAPSTSRAKALIRNPLRHLSGKRHKQKEVKTRHHKQHGSNDRKQKKRSIVSPSPPAWE